MAQTTVRAGSDSEAGFLAGFKAAHAKKDPTPQIDPVTRHEGMGLVTCM